MPRRIHPRLLPLIHPSVVVSGQVVAAPLFSVAPVVSGATTPGATLTRTLGTATATITGQWYKNAAATGVTTATYAATSGGDVVYWRSSATNAGGTAYSSSNTISVVASVAVDGAAIIYSARDQSSNETGFRFRARAYGSSGAWTTYGTRSAITATEAGYDSGTGTLFSNTIYGHPFNSDLEAGIVAINGMGTSQAYDPFRVRTSPASAPAGVSAAAQSTSAILVQWTLLASAPINGGYRVYRSEEASPSISNPDHWTLAGTVDELTNSLVVSALSAGTSHSFAVSAYNANDGGIADAETGLSAIATASTQDLTMGWEAPVAMASVGDTIVNTTGALIEAVNLGTPTSQTVNGVTFAGTSTRNGLSAPYTDPALYSDGVIGAAFGELMRSVAYGSSTPSTITLAGLTVGRTYLLQVFLSDDRAGHGADTHKFTVAGHVSSYELASLSYSRICYFVATGTTHDIAIQSPPNSDLLAGFQVRQMP